MLADDGKKTEGEVKSLSERVAKLKEDLDAAKKQHEKEIEYEKRKNELMPKPGDDGAAALNKKVKESIEKIVELERKNRALYLSDTLHRYLFCLLSTNYTCANNFEHVVSTFYLSLPLKC